MPLKPFKRSVENAVVQRPTIGYGPVYLLALQPVGSPTVLPKPDGLLSQYPAFQVRPCVVAAVFAPGDTLDTGRPSWLDGPLVSGRSCVPRPCGDALPSGAARIARIDGVGGSVFQHVARDCVPLVPNTPSRGLAGDLGHRRPLGDGRATCAQRTKRAPPVSRSPARRRPKSSCR
jgi:hypothetical protein